MCDQVKIKDPHSVVEHKSSQCGKKPGDGFCRPELFTQKPNSPCRQGKAQQKSKGRPQQISRTAAAGENRKADETGDQINRNAAKCALRTKKQAGQQHKQPLQGKVHGIRAHRDHDFYKSAHGDQSRK